MVGELYRRFRDDKDVGITFLFCNFQLQHEETDEGTIAGILKQLLIKNAWLPKAVKDIHDASQKKGTRPSYGELCNALDSAISNYSKTFIVLDALDESDYAVRRTLSKVMELQNRYHIHLLATSRFIPEVTAKFEDCPHLEIRANSDDVEKYLQGHISQLPSFVVSSADLQKEVITGIAKAVDGM